MRWLDKSAMLPKTLLSPATDQGECRGRLLVAGKPPRELPNPRPAEEPVREPSPGPERPAETPGIPPEPMPAPAPPETPAPMRRGWS